MPSTPIATQPAALSHDDIQRLHDAARHEARRLRREAVDDFWRGADAVCAAAMDRAGRSARRLASRLARHQQLRGA